MRRLVLHALLLGSLLLPAADIFAQVPQTAPPPPSQPAAGQNNPGQNNAGQGNAGQNSGQGNLGGGTVELSVRNYILEWAAVGILTVIAVFAVGRSSRRAQ